MTGTCEGASPWDCSDPLPPAARGLVSIGHLLPAIANCHLNFSQPLTGAAQKLGTDPASSIQVACPPHPSCKQPTQPTSLWAALQGSLGLFREANPEKPGHVSVWSILAFLEVLSANAEVSL